VRSERCIHWLMFHGFSTQSPPYRGRRPGVKPRPRVLAFRLEAAAQAQMGPAFSRLDRRNRLSHQSG